MKEIVKTDGNRLVRKLPFPDGRDERFVVSRKVPPIQDRTFVTLEEALRHYEELEH